MSIELKIQSKSEQILQREARFYGVTATAVAKAIIDKVVAGDMVRDVLQGVDVSSYQLRRATPAPKPPRQYRYSLNGKPVKLESLAAEFGIPMNTIRGRVKRGMTVAEAVQVRDLRFKREVGQ